MTPEESEALDRISKRIQSARSAGGSLVAVNVDDLGLLNCTARRLRGTEAALEWFAAYGSIRERKTALVVLGRATDERLPE
jgi:hypothetical protein